ncbi:MAG: N-6 DNA methylase [Planctomycetaceae bacterium]|jgi:type I restriction enzyme M protein|nr:N-6 DNA methylase [Planctomycetaceae bacterium]
MYIAGILQDSPYLLSLFTEKEINALEKRVTAENGKYKVRCIVRKKSVQLKPEEVVRQLYATKLINDYGYPAERLQFEFPVHFGREVKRADIAVLDEAEKATPYIIVEIKKPTAKDGKEQLKSYTHATGAPMAVWTNGEKITFYHRKNPNYFEDIPDLPKASQKLENVLKAPFTIADLKANDKLLKTGKSLKQLIEDMEDEVLANAGIDAFEEIFKLIFSKLYDEKQGWNDKDRNLEFRNSGLSDTQLKTRINDLFKKANEKWQGVFPADAKIDLAPSHLAICVASLEGVKLFNSNLEVIDEAFEYLINKSSKGEKGQYFTPRYVIDMCVKMLNPKADETMIDPAAGSSGFPVHTISHVWQQLYKQHGKDGSHLFTDENKPGYCTDYVEAKVFAIDFDDKAVRVARTLNLIAGDGQTNVMLLNTLDFTRWDEITADEDWNDMYNNGFARLKKLQSTKGSNAAFNFDIVMANPPFAGEIKEPKIIHRYDIARKFDKSGKDKGYVEKIDRDILFIERNLNFLKPGGRMAIVLPQGRFNNSSDKYIRDFIAERCRILAVVGLHGNTFKPHTGTKTSVLFVQKWDEVLCPKADDYNIFFATQQLSGKDNSGDKLYWKQTTARSGSKGESTTSVKDTLCDAFHHPIIYHDLFSTDGKTPPGIAEAFAEFAKKEGLSFFR